MASTFLLDQRKGGTNPAEVITTTLNGITFRAGRRTAAHLVATDEALRTKGKWLRVIQPPYNSSVSASAGTHDFDACLDVEVEGMSWENAQSELRRLGWAAWYRPHTPGLWGAHVHMVSLGCPGPVGIFVPGQVADYYAHRTGLKGHAPDRSWHPDDIDSTVFDYELWESNMPLNEADKAWIQARLDAQRASIVADLLKAAVDKAGTTVKAALRKAAGL